MFYHTSTMTGQTPQAVAADPLADPGGIEDVSKMGVDIKQSQIEQADIQADINKDIAAQNAATKTAASRSKIYAGIGQGLASGVGAVGAGIVSSRSDEKRLKEEVRAEDELMRLKFAREDERIAGNVPGQFESEVGRVEIPSWWNRHLADERMNRGLLEPSASA